MAIVTGDMTEALTHLDATVFLALNHALSRLLPLMVVLSAIGGGWGSLLVVPLFAAPRTRRFARSLSLVILTTAVLVHSLKRVVGRVRPCYALADLGVHAVDPPKDYSFPSGHSAGSFAFLVFIAIVVVRSAGPEASPRERLLRQVAAASAVTLAAMVGLSRVALGVHFPGDVLAGAILGATIAIVGGRLHHANSVGAQSAQSRPQSG